MSTPITCLPKRQDSLFHVLFCSDVHFISRLIEESVINIAREYPSQGVQQILVFFRPQERDTLDMLRAKFFILICQDMLMRKKLGQSPGKSSLISEVCPHKASRFYDELNGQLVPWFAQDQTKRLEEFIEKIRDCYLYS